MAIAVRVIQMIVRLCAVAIIVLGILLWTGNFDGLKGVHMIIGILIVLSLWALGIVQAIRGGSPVLAGAAVVLGAVLFVVGLSQEQWLAADSDPHWIIQVLHFVLGIAALGLVETVGARAKRAFAGTPSPSVS